MAIGARTLAALTTWVSALLAAQSATACSKASWPDFERRVAAAQVAFQQKDPAPLMALWSHGDDVVLMGANGGHEVGWSLVGPRMMRIAAASAGGPRKDDIVARTIGTDLAVIVQIENITNLRPDGSVEAVDHLRVTHVARCEGADWRLIQRHADRATTVQRGLIH
jgi:hypothetical protein